MNDHVNAAMAGILDAMAPTVEPAAPQPTPGDWKISKQFAEPWVEIVTVNKFGDESLPFISCRNSDKEANSLLVVAAKKTAAERDRLRAVNAELVVELKRMVQYYAPGETRPEAVGKIQDAISVIDKAEGGEG